MPSCGFEEPIGEATLIIMYVSTRFALSCCCFTLNVQSCVYCFKNDVIVAHKYVIFVPLKASNDNMYICMCMYEEIKRETRTSGRESKSK